MRKSAILVSLLLLSLFVDAQLGNIKIGYQEFPTNVTGHAADNNGNMYYSGTFKGELTINRQVLQTGSGLEDLFLVKTDTQGKVVYTRSFGSQSADLAIADGLHALNNRLYLGATITETINFQSLSVSPYESNGVNTQTSCLVGFDTSGNVKWVNRTSLGINRIYAANNIIHAVGLVPAGPSLYNEQVLFENLPLGSTVHLMLDTLGTLLNAKVASPQAQGQRVEPPLYMSSYSDGHLSLLLRVTGSSSFNFGGENIPLPNAMNNYYVIIKTDTAYNSFTYKVLNTAGVVFYNDNGSGLTMTLSNKDSVYLVLTSGNNGAGINYDGLAATVYNKNLLVVLDPLLKASRMVELGNPIFESGANFLKRRLVFRSVNLIKGHLFFTGDYIGGNESASDQITQKDSAITIMPNNNVLVDLNGPSKSFTVKTNLDFSSGLITWIGSHSEYEKPSLIPNFTHVANDSLLVFSYREDNTWNPRIIDQNTAIIAGEMIRNADLPDVVHFVHFLADASRIIIGAAKGQTALDNAGSSFKSNQQRSDAFIARISPTGEVLWYKRFYSTLLSATPMKIRGNGSKVYFNFRYFNSVNESNYIVVDQKAYKVGTSASLLGSVDASGTIDVINLENTEVSSALIADFNLCSNGDIILLTNLGSPVTFASSTTTGPHLLRLDRTSNKINTARKLVVNDPFSFQPAHVEVDKDDIMYVSVPLSSAGNAQNQYGTLSLQDGVSIIDALPIENNVIGQNEGGLGILKMTWNKFIWYKRTGGLSLFALNSRYSPAFPINNKIVFMGQPASANKSFYWDNKLVVPQMNSANSYFFRMDTAGNIELQKIINDFSLRNTKKKEDGTLLISGNTSKATSIDTIAVGYDGANDAFSFTIDTSFAVKKSFRLASAYHEFMEDFDLFKDSLVSFAYIAQTIPALKPYRTWILPTDYAADAFLSTQVIAPTSTLPLRLLSFDAKRNGNSVDLNWTIADNEDGKEYTVQRADNGGPFRSIGVVKAEKNTSVASYKWKDELKEYNRYHYRLQMVAKDGKVSYSRVVQIMYTSQGAESIYYDNSHEQLHILRADNSVYSWKVFDMSGRNLLSGGKVNGKQLINVSRLPKGEYIIQTLDEALNSETYKFIR